MLEFDAYSKVDLNIILVKNKKKPTIYRSNCTPKICLRRFACTLLYSHLGRTILHSSHVHMQRSIHTTANMYKTIFPSDLQIFLVKAFITKYL